MSRGLQRAWVRALRAAVHEVNGGLGCFLGGAPGWTLRRIFHDALFRKV